jgi:hypothetical protein
MKVSRKLKYFLRQKTVESARSEINLGSCVVGPDNPRSFWQISSHQTSPSIRRSQISRICVNPHARVWKTIQGGKSFVV